MVVAISRMLERIFGKSKLPVDGRISVIYSRLQDTYPESYRCEASKREISREKLRLPDGQEEFLFPSGDREGERVLVTSGTDGLTWIGVYTKSRRVRVISVGGEICIIQEDLERGEVVVENGLEYKKVDSFLSSLEEELEIS